MDFIASYTIELQFGNLCPSVLNAVLSQLLNITLECICTDSTACNVSSGLNGGLSVVFAD